LRAQAHSKLKNFDEGLQDIKEAIKLSPSDKALRDEFENIKALKKKESDSEKEAAKKLFASGLYNEKATPKIAKVAGLPDFNIENPQVYMDISIGAEEGKSPSTGRVIFELFNA
jgi:hypothetical protein